MKDQWWTKNRLNIIKDPTERMDFPNGYKIEKYMLTDNEVKVSFDPSIDPGLHFR